MAGKKRNPRGEAIASLDSMADAILRKRLRAMKKEKDGEAKKDAPDDFSEEQMAELAAMMEA